MDDIIKQLEACHEHFGRIFGVWKEDGAGVQQYEVCVAALAVHRALIDRLRSRNDSIELGAQCANETQGSCRGYKTPKGE